MLALLVLILWILEIENGVLVEVEFIHHGIHSNTHWISVTTGANLSGFVSYLSEKQIANPLLMVFVMLQPYMPPKLSDKPKVYNSD